MNVETGQMGTLDELLKAAMPGERVIPATIIPDPRSRHPKQRRNYRAAGSTPMSPVYGPRKPLREVRAELQSKAASEA